MKPLLELLFLGRIVIENVPHTLYEYYTITKLLIGEQVRIRKNLYEEILPMVYIFISVPK